VGYFLWNEKITMTACHYALEIKDVATIYSTVSVVAITLTVSKLVHSKLTACPLKQGA
jgi:hypothetical protein